MAKKIKQSTPPLSYFEIAELHKLRDYFGEDYDKDSDASKWFKSTADKLDYLITELINPLIKGPLVITYLEYPHKQSGKSKPLKLKEYLLRGFSQSNEHNIFIKIQFNNLHKEDPEFIIEFDRKRKKDADSTFDKYLDEERKKLFDYKVPLDSTFPNNWTDLVSQISSHIDVMYDELNDIIQYGDPTKMDITDPLLGDSDSNLNLILYGPPGTGKTFHSITHAVAIIKNYNPKQLVNLCNSKIIRKKVKEWYDELVVSGNIVFTTFHQSLGYEDFIEGIKPLPPSPKLPMQYDIIDGLFKRICEDAKGKECKYVLIIDEINRGNVAQIFGELITLLEPDKRIGQKEEISLKLPYSNKEFGVPSNLYILGTMNTADRSVEALDTALRRRFSFLPMIPQPELLKQKPNGICLKSMLEVINRRLKILKDVNHTIGHAWLWEVDNIEKLKRVFNDKIIPLLQEFFYNDYEKLGLILGDHFIEEESSAEITHFASFSQGALLRNQYLNKKTYNITSPYCWNVETFMSLYVEKEITL
jgi:hypothetical protein